MSREENSEVAPAFRWAAMRLLRNAGTPQCKKFRVPRSSQQVSLVQRSKRNGGWKYALPSISGETA
jgi:hypothetical protein